VDIQVFVSTSDR